MHGDGTKFKHSPRKEKEIKRKGKEKKRREREEKGVKGNRLKKLKFFVVFCMK